MKHQNVSCCDQTNLLSISELQQIFPPEEQQPVIWTRQSVPVQERGLAGDRGLGAVVGVAGEGEDRHQQVQTRQLQNHQRREAESVAVLVC